MKNTRVLLRRQSMGVPEPADFEVVEDPVGAPAAGQLACETLYLSLDPYLRGKISGRHISGAIGVGDLMAGEAVSRVVTANADGFAAGDIVAAHSGWQSHPVIDAASARHVNADLGPVSTTLGILGMPGLTAYAGLLRLGEPRAGDRVLVSAAAGPVGSMVGQIARIKGCTSVGIAGAPEKCRWLVEEAGFVDCINYKQVALRDGIVATCPQGVDLYFDNVGGDVLQAAMENLSLNARVVLCGLMAQYNTSDMPPGPNPAFIIKARATVRGLVVYDHEDLRPQFEQHVSGWLKEGLIRYREDVTDGLANAADAFCRLMQGKNFGKTLVRVAGED